MLLAPCAVDAFPPAPLFGLSPYILHVFVHAGWAHLLINLGVLLAVGPAVRRPFGPGLRGDTGFLVFFFACAIGGAVLHHHLVDHVEVAPRRRVVLVTAVLLELRRRDAAADGLWRGAVRELWRGAVCERGLGRRNCVARTTARQPIEFCVEPRYGGTISALVGRKRIEKTSAAWMPPIMTATGRISLVLRRAFYRRSGAVSQAGGK